MSEPLLVVMNLRRIISNSTAPLGFTKHCLAVWLQLYSFGSLSALSYCSVIFIYSRQLFLEDKPYDGTVYYLLSTKQQIDTVSCRLAGEHSGAFSR